MSLRKTGLALIFSVLATAATQAAPPVYDEIIMISNGKLARGPLPAGPIGPPIDLPPGIEMIHALPSGKILAVYYVNPDGFGLGELLADGGLRPIGIVPWPGLLPCGPDGPRDRPPRPDLFAPHDEDPVRNRLEMPRNLQCETNSWTLKF